MTQTADFASGNPLVGRVEERALLEAALRDIRTGVGRIVLINGDAGVGKSRLLREAATAARAAGGRVAFGAAYEGGAGRPFGPVVELLRSTTIGATPELRAAAAAAVAALSQPDDGNATRWAQIDAVVEVLTAAADADPPLVLIGLEDLHWADGSTLELLTQVLRQLAAAPALVVATFRPPRADAVALLSFTDSVRQLFQSARVDLGPIPDDAAMALVRSALGEASDEAQVDAIVRRGEGNPLFLEEAARDAARAAREGRAAPSVPAAIRELVQRRCAALPPDAREAAYTLAVLGEASTTARVGAVLGAAPEAVADAIDTLVAQGIAVAQSDGRIAFVHALTRDAVYEWMPVSRRQALHGRCAETIEREEGQPAAAALARHLMATGDVANERRAAALLADAGAQSLARLAYEQAAEQLAEAIALMDRLGMRGASMFEARMRLAEARGMSRADDEALDVFAAVADEAASAGEAAIEARAAVGYERVFLATGRPRSGADARSLPLLDRALSHLETDGPLDGLGARLLAARAQARFFAGRHEAALADADQAVEVAQTLGDPGVEAAALNTRRAATWSPDAPGERLDLTRTIFERASVAGDLDLQLEALYWQIEVLMETGARGDAEAALARFGILAERAHQPWRLYSLHHMRAMFLYLDGNLDDARAEARRARDFAQVAGNAEAGIVYAAQMIYLGNDVERRAALRGITRDVASLITSSARRFAAAYFLYHADERDRALSVLKAAIEADAVATLERDHLWLAMMSVLADVVIRVGEPLWSQQVYDALLPYADRFAVNSNAVCYGSVERLLGHLASIVGLPEAESHLRRANERNAAIGATVWVEVLDAPSKRVTKTFMFTDIVKSTNLVEAMGDEAWEPLLRWHNQTLGELFHKYGGEEVVSTGDGFFVAFETPEAAIDCAIAIQRRLVEHRQSSGFAPQVRIGVHATEATEVDRNYHGAGVHEAARIAALANGGEILASTSTAGSRLTLGPPRATALKGIAEPVEIVALAWR